MEFFIQRFSMERFRLLNFCVNCSVNEMQDFITKSATSIYTVAKINSADETCVADKGKNSPHVYSAETTPKLYNAHKCDGLERGGTR